MGKLIGLTGQTGAGKSTVADILQKNGYYIIDGDAVARQVVEKGSPVLCGLAARFGSDIIKNDGCLDRALLASRAFADRESTQALNEITHPAIIKKSLEMAQKAFENGFRYAVFDAAGLFESGIDRQCECVIYVTAPQSVRLSRIIQRDGISVEAAMKRICAQYNDEYYLSRSDYVIENEELEKLEEKTRQIISLIENRQ
ncbi:MAG: dephospho-CoA kinase [Clostridia bacterium]|nr:dephospho-CoA kinase [Clostridia bacterium]